uniref:C-type lectin domain family 14 member A n=1 Tax=Scatophagus argus TaxID=75038 RepID=UPI001ED7D535|nr:C-type lectin domain family 14 member A [Scatophagus argus]XP_046269669.1 C-type lectin domain family 14 member A [Scatophagus argus]XP_046269670.1 C-type lectin domain family 14 member A [Scatophagus argus]XP_046269671.1 C-type lectin domain family 14 member A [Scatophagus argus]
MEPWFCSCWVSLWMVTVLFGNITASPANYTIHHTPANFDQAMNECSPGVLTTLATEQEVNHIFKLVSESVSLLKQNELTFWIGLRKVKNECVVPMLPLRGFKWIEDGSEETQVIRWMEEPEQTCTTVRCAALKGRSNGSMVTGWGLIPVSCRTRYQFICKLRDTEPAPPQPKPTASKLKPSATEPHKPKPRPATQKPEPTTPEPEHATQEPKADTKIGPELQGLNPDPSSKPALGLDSCQKPHVPGARFLSLDNNNTRTLVDCWTTMQLELHCAGRPAVWRLLDSSPANLTTICQPCEIGFQKDASGRCVDIDECGGGDTSCRHTCLNTEGSYRCVCSDESGEQHNEDSPVCTSMLMNDDNSLMSDVLMWVLVAVAALVVLVVVAVTIKCCLKRCSKKQEEREKMALKSKDDKDSLGTANEKAAV